MSGGGGSETLSLSAKGGTGPIRPAVSYTRETTEQGIRIAKGPKGMEAEQSIVKLYRLREQLWKSNYGKLREQNKGKPPLV
eukprot:2441783-Heterocapsa_arctica.AAC.1